MNPGPTSDGGDAVEGPPPAWAGRKRRAATACAHLRGEPDDLEVEEEVRAFAEDQKWEVRKVVADALAHFSEGLFRELEPILRNDSHSLVKDAARRSRERRSPAPGSTASMPAVIQGELDKIESQYGRTARTAAQRLAEKFVELHIRNAVHDIRNILTYFKLDLDQVAPLLPDEKSRDGLRRFVNGRNYLEGLVAVMIQYSEDLSLKLRPESISEILTESVDSAIEQLDSLGRPTDLVKCEVTSDGDLFFPVSRFHLVMVVTNLVKNGIEAHATSEREMQPGSVRVEAHIEDDSLVVVVEDTGVGIAAGDLAKLREFIPGGSSKGRAGNRSGSGSGYGLPICRRYVEAHGGSITIESEEDIGTRVTVRIPMGEDSEEGD